MDDRIRDLMGSRLRDEFKHAHKQAPFPADFWSIDVDLMAMGKTLPLFVMDAKGPGDQLTYNEKLAYRWYVDHYLPVFTLCFERVLHIEGDPYKVLDVDSPITICEFLGKQETTQVQGMAGLAKWEASVRERLGNAAHGRRTHKED